jgi:metal-responsive CopG/Arc/MetJ family transcriptional regulator
MRRVTILLDEKLLADLDSDDEVRRFGRSKVLGQIVTDDLHRQRESRLDAAYCRGYGDASAIEQELDGWGCHSIFDQ